MPSTAILCKYFGAQISDATQQKFILLARAYQYWNQKINLISRKDIAHIYTRHFLHSLALAHYYDFSQAAQVLDLGTGGGLPALPLALLYPQSIFYLNDSIAKKLRAAEAIAQEVSIPNTRILHTRAETICHKNFDAIVCRGVAPLAQLITWSAPLRKKNTPLLCLKGGNLADEIAACGNTYKIVQHRLSELLDDDFFAEKYVLVVR